MSVSNFPNLYNFPNYYNFPNWYRLLKISAIWDVEYDSYYLTDLLKSLYEVTYKYQRIFSQPFYGYPKRKENILSQLENKARDITYDISSFLLPTFEQWLRTHALLNPALWASNRLDSYIEADGSSVNNLMSFLNGELNRLGKNNLEKDSYLLQNLDEPVKNGQAPHLQQIFDSFKEESIEDLKNEIQQEKDRINSLDQNEEYDTVSVNEESSIQSVQEMSFSDFISDYYSDDLLEFLVHYEQSFDILPAFTEIIEFVLFPVWFEYWDAQGIVETRQRVEDAYQRIKQLQSLPIMQLFASINIIINTAHQTGSMAQYLADHAGESEEDILSLLDALSEGNEGVVPIKEWDKQIKEVGSIDNYNPNNYKLKNYEPKYNYKSKNKQQNQVLDNTKSIENNINNNL